MGTIGYLKNFIKDPKVASITPTSRFTIEKVSNHMDFSRDIRVLEFGPADGVFTNIILEKMSNGSEIAAIETNNAFVDKLRGIGDKRLSVIHKSVEFIEEITTELKWDHVDYVVSGIPFSFLDEEIKERILSKSANLLSDKGVFLAYQTSKHLQPHLEKHFKAVNTSMEYRNIPPMCIYCAKNG